MNAFHPPFHAAASQEEAAEEGDADDVDNDAGEDAGEEDDDGGDDEVDEYTALTRRFKREFPWLTLDRFAMDLSINRRMQGVATTDSRRRHEPPELHVARDSKSALRAFENLSERAETLERAAIQDDDVFDSVGFKTPKEAATACATYMLGVPRQKPRWSNAMRKVLHNGLVLTTRLDAYYTRVNGKQMQAWAKAVTDAHNAFKKHGDASALRNALLAVEKETGLNWRMALTLDQFQGKFAGSEDEESRFRKVRMSRRTARMRRWYSHLTSSQDQGLRSSFLAPSPAVRRLTGSTPRAAA